MSSVDGSDRSTGDPRAVLALADRLAELGIPDDALLPVRDWAERRLCQVAGCTSPREVTVTLRDGSVVATCYRHEVPRDER